jgi:protein PhnA
LFEYLWVKGARFTAERGTTVRGISLVQDNNDHIKGRVAGQRIVTLPEFVIKK